MPAAAWGGQAGDLYPSFHHKPTKKIRSKGGQKPGQNIKQTALAASPGLCQFRHLYESPSRRLCYRISGADKPMRTRATVFAFTLLFGFAGALALLWWLGRGVETVETVRSGSQDLAIISRVQERIYAGLPHMAGWYLSKGNTRVEIADGPRQWLFDADEELDLIGIHIIDDRLLLLFDARYRPERGFMAFQAMKDSSFSQLPLNQVPPEAAFPNFGPRGRIARGFFDVAELSAVPPDGFYDTSTARLWSQMATNVPVLGNQLSGEAVRERWKNWSPIIAGAIRVSKR